MFKCLRETLGNITKACELAQIDRSTHYEWLKDDNYRQQVEDIDLEKKDVGENALMKLVKQGHPQSVIFFNERYNKEKYSKKEEIQHSGEVDNHINIEIIDSNNENKDE